MIGNKIKTFNIGDYFITTRQLISLWGRWDKRKDLERTPSPDESVVVWKGCNPGIWVRDFDWDSDISEFLWSKHDIQAPTILTWGRFEQLFVQNFGLQWPWSHSSKALQINHLTQMRTILLRSLQSCSKWWSHDGEDSRETMCIMAIFYKLGNCIRRVFRRNIVLSTERFRQKSRPCRLAAGHGLPEQPGWPDWRFGGRWRRGTWGQGEICSKNFRKFNEIDVPYRPM